jgi:hypothetical protein
MASDWASRWLGREGAHALRFVSGQIRPLLEAEAGGESALSLLTSANVLQRHNDAVTASGPLVPGLPLLPTAAQLPLLVAAARCMRLADAAYGTKGAVWFDLARRRAPTSGESQFAHATRLVGRLAASAAANAVPSALAARLGLEQGEGRVVRAKAGLAADALLFESDDDGRAMSPKLFLVRDDEARALVLAIRGTVSTGDVLTDLYATPEPFLHLSAADATALAAPSDASLDVSAALEALRVAGSASELPALADAHGGIARAAQNVYASLFSLTGLNLPRRLADHPGYALRVCGHSLGAGTAVLLTLLVHHQRALTEAALGPAAAHFAPLHGVAVQCFAFAPPAVLARRVSAASPLSRVLNDALEHVHCFVYGDDLVPRLCMRSVQELVRMLRTVATLEPSLARRMFASGRVAGALPEKLRAALRAGDAAAATDGSPPPFAGASGGGSGVPTAVAPPLPRLEIPGRLFYLRQEARVVRSAAAKLGGRLRAVFGGGGDTPATPTPGVAAATALAGSGAADDAGFRPPPLPTTDDGSFSDDDDDAAAAPTPAPAPADGRGAAGVAGDGLVATAPLGPGEHAAAVDAATRALGGDAVAAEAAVAALERGDPFEGAGLLTAAALREASGVASSAAAGYSALPPSLVVPATAEAAAATAAADVELRVWWTAATATDFDDVVMTSDTVDHHYPEHYDQALARLLAAAQRA